MKSRQSKNLDGGVNLAVQRTSALPVVTATLITGTVTAFIDGIGKSAENQLNRSDGVAWAPRCVAT